MTVSAGETGLSVEVVYALPDTAFRVELTLPAGATVRQALERSGVFERFPELDAPDLRVGIFGVPCAPSAVIRSAARVEIYRPLAGDVKRRRRERVALVRRRRKGID